MNAYAYAAFDTETSGLFDKSRPDTADGQPRVCSLSITRASPTWSTQSEDTIYVRPDDWKNADGSIMRVMPAEAEAVHGLSYDFLFEHGRPITEAVDMWVACIEEGRVMCGHSARFDVRVMRAELARLGRPSYEEKLLVVCTMMKTVGILRLRQENGSMKTPTLEEAMRHFKMPQLEAHTSRGDTTSVVQLMRRLSQIGIDLTPQLVPVKDWKPPKEKSVASIEGKAPRKAPKVKEHGQSNWLLPDKAD